MICKMKRDSGEFVTFSRIHNSCKIFMYAEVKGENTVYKAISKTNYHLSINHLTEMGFKMDKSDTYVW